MKEFRIWPSGRSVRSDSRVGAACGSCAMAARSRDRGLAARRSPTEFHPPRARVPAITAALASIAIPPSIQGAPWSLEPSARAARIRPQPRVRTSRARSTLQSIAPARAVSKRGAGQPATRCGCAPISVKNCGTGRAFISAPAPIREQNRESPSAAETVLGLATGAHSHPPRSRHLHKKQHNRKHRRRQNISIRLRDRVLNESIANQPSVHKNKIELRLSF